MKHHCGNAQGVGCCGPVRRLSLGITLAGWFATVMIPVEAQENNSSLGSTSLEEIVVTAQKREQRLNDIGISVAVASADQLKVAGITEVTMLPQIVPGLNTTQSRDGYPLFSLRGVNFNFGQLAAASAVSTYVDGAILAYPTETNGMLLDVAQIEVLKGPQGTLFGQNATGGAINIISAKPTSILAAGFDTSINNFGQGQLDGFVSGPVSDTLRARLSASTTQGGPWQKGYFENDRENGSANKSAMRLLLDWDPSDRFKLGLNLNGNYDNSQGQGRQLSQINIQNPANPPPGLATYPLAPANDRAADLPIGQSTQVHNQFYQGVLHVDWTPNDEQTFTAITDYTHLKYFSPILEPTTLQLINSLGFGNISSISQELRLAGTLPSERLHYILGGNYQDDKVLDAHHSLFPFYSGFPPNSSLNNAYNVTNRSVGVFGNLDWEFIDKLTLTTGVRYTRAKEGETGCMSDTGDGTAAALFGSLANAFRSAEGLPPTDAYHPGGCVTLDDRPILAGGQASYLPYYADVSQNEHNVSWRGGLNFKPTDDLLIYGLVSRGFKAGGFIAGFNTNAAQLAPVKQEELTAYETGIKATLLNQKLQINSSVFYYDYLNKQFATFTPSVIGLVQLLTNIPKSKADGVDVDITALPISGLTLRSSLTYVHSQVGSYVTYGGLGTLENIGGNQFNYAPPWSATSDIDYHFAIGGGRDAFVGASALYNSKAYSDLNQTPSLAIDSYVVLNARIGVDWGRGWRTSLWARNIANKYYWSTVISGGDDLGKYTGLPRTFGATVSYQFGQNR
jgi:outer membrane receptor protein involved in Fe transport